AGDPAVVVGGGPPARPPSTRPATPTDFFADSQHPGTVVQGLFANMFIAAADKTYGADIAPLSDQEILQYAGITPPTSGPTYFDVSRFVIYPNHPGNLDTTFGNPRIVTTNLGSPDDEATNIFVQPDGKLLVAGFTQDTVHNDYALTLSRYQANGSLDTTYGTGGTVITGLTSPNAFYP